MVWAVTSHENWALIMPIKRLLLAGEIGVGNMAISWEKFLETLLEIDIDRSSLNVILLICVPNLCQIFEALSWGLIQTHLHE